MPFLRIDMQPETTSTAELLFMYRGPNRRNDWPVAEFRVELSDRALTRLASHEPDEWVRRIDELVDGPGDWLDPNESTRYSHSLERAGWLMARLLLKLQRMAGQRVEDFGLLNHDDSHSCRAFVAVDHPDAFMPAFELAEQILVEVLDGDDAVGGKAEIKASILTLIDEFSDTGTPADVWAMMQVAMRRGIPLLRMDRPPYDPIEGPFRIRRNGLVRFGHGHRQLTVDGTFCVNRSEHLHPLVFDRVGLFERLSAMGWNVPEFVRCGSIQRVERAVRRFDYPLAVLSARRGGQAGEVHPLADLDSLRAAADGILSESVDVILQSWVHGQRIRVMVIGGRCLAVRNHADEQWRQADHDERDWGRLVQPLIDSLDTGAFVVDLVWTGVGDESVWLLDLDLAPRLDQMLQEQPELLMECAESFMEWLFPDASLARIPIAAITGTNGKTTTCHMTRSILAASGSAVGMTCSDGCMIRDEWVTDKEEGHFFGHTIVLDNPETEVAVLESTRGGAGSIGMGFARCQVAACLNVSEDHLDDRIGLQSVAEVAELKCTILKRSDDAIVLNADDGHCMAMRKHLTEYRLGLVSATRGYQAVKKTDASVELIGVLESIDGQPWLVLYHRGERHVLIAGSDLPLSFANTAEHNLANALHAAVISFLMGVRPEHIVAGLRTLQPDFETFRGRLNHYLELPFEVIMDYAHNPDGLTRLCEFVKRWPVQGRKLINLSIGAHNPDDFLRRSAAVTAGHFDHYVCKNFGLLMGRDPEERPRLLREGLLSAGVDESIITCVEDEFESIDATFNLARPGDLVIIIGGKRKRQIWNWIRSWPERQAVLNKSPP
jgi:UDP-N-acetylmuramyl tripeptide synthase